MPPAKKSATQAEVVFVQLKNCLINLPQSLVNALVNINTPAQNVVVELIYKYGTSPATDRGSASRSAYVGWTGMPSSKKVLASSGNPIARGSNGKISDVVIELDATFGRTLGLTEGQRVGVLLHVDPPQVHTVNIEPLTPGDWQMIELHANFLELNLLSQIRALPNPSFSAVSSKQVQETHPLTLHLSPTSTANIVVTSLLPALSKLAPFAKLAPDAEVIVASKSRPRVSESKDSRSIGSTGRRSAGERNGRSDAQQHSQLEDAASRKVMLLRPCDRTFCDNLFDDDDCGQENTGLRVWIDADICENDIWKVVRHVVVSVIRPTSAEAAQPGQRSKDIAMNSENPASAIVATLLSWYDAPSDRIGALSSNLCSALGIKEIVGGLVRIEAATPPLPKRTVSKLKIYPFVPHDQPSTNNLKFGGETRAARDFVAQNLRELLRSESGTKDTLLDGPLTDRLVIPSIENVPSMPAWNGGILRFDLIPPFQPTTKTSWILGSDVSADIEVQAEISDPSLTDYPPSNVQANMLPADEPRMVGVENLAGQLASQLSHRSSALLTGGAGSGKSSLVQLTGHRLRLKQLFHITYFSCRQIATDEARISTVKETLSRLFVEALWGAQLGGKSLIILDDLDKLCPAETELQTHDNSRSRQASELLCSFFRQYCSGNTSIALLATAQNKDSLNNIVIGMNVFKEIITLKAPDKNGRRLLLRSLLSVEPSESTVLGKETSQSVIDQSLGGNAWMDESAPSSPVIKPGKTVMIDRSLDLLDIAGQTDGFMAGDLGLLVSRAKSEALIRSVVSAEEEEADSSIIITKNDFENALKGFTPASLRNVTLQSSKTTFGSIGGLKSTRKTLLETLQYPTLYAPIFAQCPLRLRSGLLLYGYPGCGKTLLASAVAGECGLNFITIKGPEILNKYIGASEKSVRDLFERAESAKPCVLFFDEFDSIAPKRGHDSTGVTDRVVNQLLTQMDGAEGLSGVYVLAATSRPDLIDPALLRPGRLDKSIICDLPNLDDRLDILQVISKKLKVSPEMLSSKQQGFYEVATRTEGYSGADLQAVIYNAHLEAIHDSINDRSINGRSETKNTTSARLLQTPKNEIFQFRFGKDVNADDQAIGISRAEELSEYHSILAQLEALKQIRRKERYLQRGNDDHYHQATSRKKNGTAKEVVIQWKHIEASLATTRSSIGLQERNRLQKIYREFVVGRNGEMPNGEGSTEIGGRSSLM